MKHRERIQKFREAGDLNHIYKNELDKACFAHDTADFERKIQLRGAYEIAIDPKLDEYQRGLTSMMYKFFDKKIGSGKTSKKRSNLNEMLGIELHKPLTKKLKRRKVYAILCIDYVS